MSAIFISYRRADSFSIAQRIYKYLRPYYYEDEDEVEDELFVDVDNIGRGVRFPDVIRDTLERTHLMVVIIGPKWLRIKDRHGKRRLSQKNDYVRLEIAYALAQGIPIYPVLANGAEMPKRSDLPPSLSGLESWNGIEISEGKGFRAALEQLHHDIDQFLMIEQQQAYDIFANYPTHWFNATRIGTIAEENETEPLGSLHVDDIEEILEDMWEGELLTHKYSISGSNQYRFRA